MPSKGQKPTKRFLTGDRELDAIFSSLSDRQTNQLGRAALNAAASNTSKAMKKLVPVDTGQMKKAVGVARAKRGRKSGQLLARVGVRSDDKFTTTKEDGSLYRPYKVAHIVERGSEETVGSYFMRRAAMRTRGQNKAIMITKIKETLEKQIKKARKKGKIYFRG